MNAYFVLFIHVALLSANVVINVMFEFKKNMRKHPANVYLLSTSGAYLIVTLYMFTCKEINSMYYENMLVPALLFTGLIGVVSIIKYGIKHPDTRGVVLRCINLNVCYLLPMALSN